MPSETSPVPRKDGLTSVILPTYDERENIALLISELHRLLLAPHEIIVVDDNSPDGTSEAVRAFIEAHPAAPVRLETRMADHGLVKSIQRGIELARGDVICWMDCDFSHPPATMQELVGHVRGGSPAIAVASRYVAGGSYKRGLSWFGADESALGVLLSRLINWFIHQALDPRFHDYTSGFIATRRATLERFLPLEGEYGEYFMALMYGAVREGHSFVEVPFVSPPRRAGYSKTGTTFRQLFRRGVPYLRFVLRVIGQRIRGPTGSSSILKE